MAQFQIIWGCSIGPCTKLHLWERFCQSILPIYFWGKKDIPIPCVDDRKDFELYLEFQVLHENIFHLEEKHGKGRRDRTMYIFFDKVIELHPASG